jgi:hypothetical protein
MDLVGAGGQEVAEDLVEPSALARQTRTAPSAKPGSPAVPYSSTKHTIFSLRAVMVPTAG